MNVSVLSLFCSLPSHPTLNLGCWSRGKSDTVCPFTIYQLHMRSHSTGVRGRNYFASRKGKIRKKAGALSCEQDDRKLAPTERSVKLHRDGSTNFYQQ